MKFLVRFVGEDYTKQAVFYPKHETGIDFVDAAREAAGLPNLPADVCDSFAYQFEQNCTIVLTEEQARKSKLFADRNKVTVEVPHQYLNQFVAETVEFDRDDDGRVTAAHHVYSIEEDSLVKAWAAAGYPTEWENITA